MAATNEVRDLTEGVFEQAGLALDESFTDRVRQLGDSSCKAGIKATIAYLSAKSELSDSELQMLAAGDIPEHIKKTHFDAHIERLSRDVNPKPDEKDEKMCYDAFSSGLTAAIFYLLESARSRDIDLLAVVPSSGE